MITVHHLENSRSQRILWLLEELGVEYRIVRYPRDKSTGLAPPELLAVHPLGKAPVITDGDVTVAESGAIIEYLADRYDDGRLRPAEGTPERLAYTYWLHYAEGTFMPLMILSLIMRRIASAPMPFFVKPVARGIVAKVRSGYLDPNLERNLAFMESSLAGSDAIQPGTSMRATAAFVHPGWRAKLAYANAMRSPERARRRAAG